jgi:hypothetical protein
MRNNVSRDNTVPKDKILFWVTNEHIITKQFIPKRPILFN